MDYRALLLEIFGTADEEKLREIAGEYRAGKRKNLGRNKQFNSSEVSKMLLMQKNGSTIDEIAREFGATRQTLAKYISSKPTKEFPYVIDYMLEHKVCASIYINFKKEQVKVVNRTNDIMNTPFGVVESPTWKDFEDFLSYRCFPENRYDKKAILNAIQVPFYDPWLICQKTKGKITDDKFWLQFKSLEV